MFRLSWVINIALIFHISSSSSEDYSSIERLIKTNAISTAETTFDLRESMPSIKSLTCTLCKIIMESDTLPFKSENKEAYNISSRDTVLEQKGVGETHHQVIVKDLSQNCQSIMNSKDCTEYHEPPNTYSDDPSHSDDIKILKVFQDILAHRTYLQTNYKLGLSYEQHPSTKHRVKRFLDKPILRPDDKDNTPTCNQCDEDLGYCDIFNLVTYILCGFPRVLWDNFLGGTACTLLFTPASIRCFIYSWNCYQAECGFFNF